MESVGWVGFVILLVVPTSFNGQSEGDRAFGSTVTPTPAGYPLNEL